MKIVVSNTAALNGGDAAILYATIDILRRAFGDTLEVTAADMQADAAARHHPGLRFQPTLYNAVTAWAGRGAARKPALLLVLAIAALGRFLPGRLARRLLPRPLRLALDTFAAADAVVSAGGTYLVPHYELTPKLYDFLVTLALGRPLILFTQSLGPFDGLSQRRLLRFILRRARLILVRDERSVGHLRALGVAANVRVAADAAFALAAEAPAARRPDRLPRAPRIAISVRDWPHFQGDAQAGMARYRAAVAAFAAALAGRGAEITFVSTCQGIADYWTDDSRVAERIAGLVPADRRARITVDRDFRTPDALIGCLAGFDLVVATRMHAAILALCAGTPVLAIAYEFKTRQLFARLGLDDLTLDADGLTGDSLIETFDRYAAVLPRLGATLWPAVGRERQSALAVATVLVELLGRRSARDQRETAEQDGGTRRAHRAGTPEAAQREG
ncbi:MAG: polysaccharide pyruvyl transferase family protein, partial [Candidatus Eiseniibacteriota bacterium]